VANSPGRDLVYSWDFGDGTTATGAAVSHSYQQTPESNNFTYSIGVTVRDPLGRTSSDTVNLKVLPQKPTAAFTYSEETDYYYGQYDQYMDFDASASTFHTQYATYSWDFGDGGSDGTQAASDKHYYSNTGTYTVILTVTDGAGQTSTFNMSVSVQ
jgi:PKD repeat protein